MSPESMESRELALKLATALGYTYDGSAWWTHPDGTRTSRDGVPHFTRDWLGMQLVVEAMTARGWAVMIESNASGFLVPWTCLFASRIGRKSAIGTSAPETCARAALAALGVPVKVDE